MIKILKLITITLIVLWMLLMSGCTDGIFNAVESGDVDTVRLLLDKYPGLIHSRDTSGYSLLHRAAQNGRLQLIELLIKKGLHIDDPSHNGNKLTPLHLAAWENQIDTALLLLEKGADIDAVSKGTQYKDWSALAFACWNNHKDMVELLIRKGASLKPPVLWCAVYQGNKGISELLLAKGAEADDTSSKAWEPLHVAVEKGFGELVQLLLEHGADVNRRYYGNRIPLHEITYWNKDHVEITQLLLAYGAEVNAVDSYRDTPLHKAAREGLTGTASLLLEKGAKLDLINDMEQTPLDLADHEGRQAVVRLLLSMHSAAKKGDLAAVKDLIKTYPQLINSRDLDGKTPLHFAAENNHLEIAHLLIDNGADANVVCKYKSIQLLYGTVAKLLVPRVGHIKRIKDQKTPLELALQKGYSQMAQLLKEHLTGK
jgi:ankyrin repeat protein